MRPGTLTWLSRSHTSRPELTTTPVAGVDASATSAPRTSRSNPASRPFVAPRQSMRSKSVKIRSPPRDRASCAIFRANSFGSAGARLGYGGRSGFTRRSPRPSPAIFGPPALRPMGGLAEHGPQHGQESGHPKRLVDVVRRTAFQRLGFDLRPAERGDDNHRKV